MALTTSAAIILDARAVSGPAKGILQIGQSAAEDTLVAGAEIVSFCYTLRTTLFIHWCMRKQTAKPAICHCQTEPSSSLVIPVCHPETRAFAATKSLP
jgi:hypothetical protein